jgi:hypothetical protein
MELEETAKPVSSGQHEMAIVRVNRWKAQVGTLPMTCMRCGAPASSHVPEEFHWNPRWVYFFLPLLVIVLLNLWHFFFRDKVHQWTRVRSCWCHIPMCSWHRLAGEVRKLAFVSCLFALPFICVIASSVVELEGIWIGVAALAAWLPFLVIAGWLQLSGLRATEISDEAITFSGACEEFAETLQRSDHE